MAKYKTAEQREFVELMTVLRQRFGYNQKRIAQASRVSEPMISLVVAGERSPGEPSLELLRRELDGLTSVKAGGTASAHRELRQQLDYLRKHAPKSFETAKSTVSALYRQAVAGVKTSLGSAAVSLESNGLRQAARSVRKSSARRPR